MTKEELLTKKIGAISLGCDKNRVDLEKMLGDLKQFGFKIENDITDAEIIIVNTCAFINPAIKEAVDNILLAIEQKNNKCEKVIVTGCLVERHLEEIKQEFSEVDLFVRVKDDSLIVEKIQELYNVDARFSNKKGDRLLTTPNHFAYLKIADGCNNGCAYCTITRIRGRYVSEPMEDLVREAKFLAGIGVKELIIVAQDITRYGEDLYNKPCLIELLTQLSKVKGIEWIRLHYCYPENVNKELLDFIVSNDKICNYIDVPLQHIDNEILYNMNRRCNEEQTRELIHLIKTQYPQISIRSTFIVGLPGENGEKFRKLVNFVKCSQLNNVGFFPYYREEKTKAYFMKKQVFNFIKNKRLKVMQKLQQSIATELNMQRLGQVVRVIVDNFDETTGNYICRDEFNSPNVDFEILVSDNGKFQIGDMITVELVEYIDGYFKGEQR